MDIFKEIAPLKKYLKDKKRMEKMIGLVPTMGALHEGHLALVKASKMENDVTIGTIFINPTQFNNKSDLQKYPRTYESDLAKLKKAGCDVVFCPDTEEIYTEDPLISIDFGLLATEMEGKFRPGHFSGVGLIVSKLFNIVSPHRAYFGQKDLQQFFVIQRLVKDLSFDIELRCQPIVREENGLAMSSRNMRLSENGRENATALFQGLKKAEASIKNGNGLPQIREEIAEFMAEHEARLEYFEMIDANDMKLIDDYSSSTSVALCIAAFVEGVRLIDNLLITLANKSNDTNGRVG